MKRSHLLRAAAVLLAVAAPAFAAPVPSEQSPLAWLPASTPVVVHVNGLHNLRDHLVAFLKNAVPDSAAMVQQVSENFFRDGFDGHKIRGVPKNGHILVALMDLNHVNDAVPDLAVIVAVEDYKTFRDNLFNEEERKTLTSEDGYDSILLDDLPFPGKSASSWTRRTTPSSRCARSGRSPSPRAAPAWTAASARPNPTGSSPATSASTSAWTS